MLDSAQQKVEIHARGDRVAIVAPTEREQVEQKAENVEQEQREPEVGHGGKNRREGRQDAIEDRAPPPGDENAQEGPDREAQQKRDADENDRPGQILADNLHDRRGEKGE